jgi:O-antigen/teichoic acid export membrane protein
LNNHSFLYFIIRAGNGVVAIATVVIFTRLLSPEEYGFYALCMSIASVASVIFFQWLNEAVVRFYPLYIHDSSKVMAVAIRGFLAGTAATTLMCLGILPFHDVFGLEPVLIGILLLITIALGFYSLVLRVAIAECAPVRFGLLSWAKNGGALLAGFVLISYGFTQHGALLGFLMGLVFAVMAFASKPLITMKLGNVDASLFTEMFRYGWPLTLSSLAILVVDVADRFMIGNLLGASHVAPYAVAYDLVQQSVGTIMNVLFLATFPLIVKVFEGKHDETTRIHLQALGKKLIGLGLPVVVGIGVIASDIAEIMVGNGYRQGAGEIMPWLAAAIFVGAFKSYFFDLVFQLRNATQYQGLIAILMAAVNIIMNSVLLPRFGVIAAAWATLAAFLVGALASWHLGKSMFLLPSIGMTFWHSALASVTMGCVIYSLPATSEITWLLVKIVFGLSIYAVMAWSLDIANFRSLLKAWLVSP